MAILSKGFATRYGSAATYEDERRIRRAAAKFWRTVSAKHVGWLQPHEGEAARAAMIEAFDGGYTARDVAMMLDMATDEVDFRVKASVGYWLADAFEDVCNS